MKDCINMFSLRNVWQAKKVCHCNSVIATATVQHLLQLGTEKLIIGSQAGNHDQ